MNDAARVPGLLKLSYLVLVAGLVPLVRPALPANTAILDLVNAPFIFVFWIWLIYWRSGEVRLGWPAVIILLGSLLAMFNSQAVATNFVSLVQEAYLFAFLLTVYNIVSERRDLKVLTLAWLLFAAMEGAMTIGGLRGQADARAQGTFENPNMAASYLGVSSFLAVQQFNLPWPIRALTMLFVIGGMLAAKSMSALLGLMLGCSVVAVVMWLRSRSGSRGLMGVALLGLLVVGAPVAIAVAGSRHFVDRMPKSADERSVVWSTGLKSFLGNPLGIGVGPAGFREVGYVAGGHYGVGRRISLHDDYLAFLVERGVPGFVGLLLLLGSLGRSVYRVLRFPTGDFEPAWDAALAGMFTFVLVDSTFHEVMHYRHVWLVFALILAREKVKAGGAPQGLESGPALNAQ